MFQNNTDIVTFGELKYFGITNMGSSFFNGCTKLEYVEMPFKMEKFGSIGNCPALRKIVFNEGYTSASYGMFTNLHGKHVTFVFPTTLTYWGGSIFVNTNLRTNFVYIFKGDVGNFTDLRNTNSNIVAGAIYVADQYFENYREYLNGYPAYNRLHRLSEYVEN